MSDAAIKLRTHVPGIEGDASRGIDVISRTPLDTVAENLRTTSGTSTSKRVKYVH